MDFPSQIPLATRTRLLELGISPEDVTESFIRGTGPGGQKINKTSSTVVLREKGSGLEVRCQRERSQSANRLAAWAELCEKLSEARRVVAKERRAEAEKNRRRSRQKSKGQKRRMVDTKRFHSRKKAARRSTDE